ncbi:MAG: magnesium transporter [Elusimicrobiota bacterium]
MAPPPELHPIELFVPEIKQLLEKKRLIELKEVLEEINPIDLADGMRSFSPEEQVLLLKLLKPIRLMEVFEELDIQKQEYIVNHLEDQTLAPLLEGIPPEVTAELFKKLPDKIVKKMTKLMNHEKITVVNEILEYPDHTAGSIMSQEFLSVDKDLTAKAAIERLQACTRVRSGQDINTLYATNGNRKLIGALSLQTLIGAPGDIKIKEIMSPVSVIKINVKTDKEEASKIFTRYKVLSAPVVNDDNRLVGVLSAEDAIEVIEQENTEDIQKLAGVEALEQPYFKTRVIDMVKKRATWLCVLFLGQTLTATAMGFFEGEIARAAVLALFIPLVISSGGNSGSQAATLIVRALSLKEITFRDWWHVVRREFSSGLALGVILGSLGFLGIFTWGNLSHLYGPHYILVATTVALALVLIVLWGSVVGSLLPIFLKKLKLDPAVASAPFVATLVDVTGLIIYFSVASIILRGTLL